MSNMDPLEVFQMYLALKLHFTSESYNYFQYNGKLKTASKEKFLTRKDKHHFIRIAHSYQKEEILDAMVANFLHDPKTWIADISSREGHHIYQAYQARTQSIEYIFKKELTQLLEDNTNPLKIINGQNPEIVNSLLSGKISFETFIILDDILHFFKVFDEKLDDEYLWPKQKLLCNKYRGFLHYNKEACKKILGELLK